MNTLLQDFRYGLRMLAKAPGFTFIAILTLALGIGANSTIFSWINSTLLNPIPGMTNGSEVVSMARGTAEGPGPFSYPDYKDLRDQNHSFSNTIAYSLWQMSLTGTNSGKPEQVWGMLASANFFSTLGVHPILGRGFLPGEEEKPDGAPVAVLSYRLWQTHFGGEASAIGRTIQINQHPFTIVGVAPANFRGPETGLSEDIWVPLSMEPNDFSQTNRLTARDDNWLQCMGRMKPGVTREQAQADMSVVMQRIAQQYPNSHKTRTAITLFPLWRAPWSANFYMHTILAMLLAISGVVLLLACANVANLLLVRSVGRRREIAIRLSMGASRWRLIRQLLVESMILALCGGAIAMEFTVWTSGALSNFIPPSDVPIDMHISADRTVLLATLIISLLTGVIFGILPALRSSGVQPVAVLKEESGSVAGGGRKARLSSILVVCQIAASLLLLICAGLFIRSFRKAQDFNPGFDPHHVLIASFQLNGVGYTGDTGMAFDRQLLGKLQAIPGVQAATLADWVPLGFSNSDDTMIPDGYVAQPKESMNIADASVGPDYFRTMAIPLVEGREFTQQDDRKSQRVAIVNREFVRRYWPREDAIGKKITMGDTSFAVIGVARNSDYEDLQEPKRPFVYFSLFQEYSPRQMIQVRVAGDPLAYAAAAEKAVHELNAELPVYDIATLDSRILLNTTNQRIAGAFIGGFGLLALILAAVGIYGVLSYTTRQRTHEIGVRMALGAEPSDVFRLILLQGARLAFLGLTIGLLASFALTRVLSSELFGVTATDPLTFAGVAILLLVVALLACYFPARSAMRTDPMIALRYE